MPRRLRLLELAVAIAALPFGVGCGSNLHAMRGTIVSGGPMLYFWPPPEATAVWSAPPSGRAEGKSLADEAAHVADQLRIAGYGDARWYAIGPHYAHGFVVTTRLERMGPTGASEPGARRWSPAFPEAANVFWLEGARTSRLPDAGRFRVFLVAFTDLPIGPTRQAVPWREDTWLDERPRAPEDEVRAGRLVGDYRLGFYVYEYEASAGEENGAFVLSDPALPAARQLERAGLTALASP